jgi:LuxR family quorum sensing-dependent transcriptional regulator
VVSASKMEYGELAFGAVDDFERASSLTELSDRMAKVIGNFGYGQFIIGSLRIAAAGKFEPCALAYGWPASWRAHYVRESYFQDDPVTAWATKTVHPFDWSQAPYDGKRWPRAREVMGVARDFGLRRGFAVPVVRSHGVDIVSMAGERPERSEYAKRALHLIALYAHAKAVSLAGSRQPADRKSILTAGEREVLRWTAEGKSTWEISVILEISEATVFWRIKNAVAKLDAMNRTHAVIKAIRAKEISL